MNTPNRDKTADVIAAFVTIGKEGKIFTLSLSDFKSVYFQMRAHNPDIKIDIVLNGNWALAQFSEICNHRIRILPDNHFIPIKKALGYRLHIDEKDFEFASPFINFFGQKERFSFLIF
jgi:hypothetical protein